MTLHRYDFFNNNTYVRMDNLTSQKALRHLLQEDIRFTNIPCKLSRFIRLLIEHEKSHNLSKKRGLKIRYGSIFTFLLPDKDSHNNGETLLKGILKEFNDLPYAAFFSTEGQGTYLKVYICERPFIPEGKEVFHIAQKDRYRNKKTGRICKAEDVNTEDLQVVYKAGDVMGSEKVYFLTKTGVLKFATSNQFDYFIAKLKNLWINLLQRICKTDVEEKITFHKLSRKDSSKSCLKNVKIINKALTLIEEHFNGALYAIKFCECYDDRAIKKLKDLYRRFSDFIKNEGCTYNGYYLSLNKKVKKSEIIAASAEMFVEKFKEEMSNVFVQIVPQF